MPGYDLTRHAKSVLCITTPSKIRAQQMNAAFHSIPSSLRCLLNIYYSRYQRLRFARCRIIYCIHNCRLRQLKFSSPPAGASNSTYIRIFDRHTAGTKSRQYNNTQHPCRPIASPISYNFPALNSISSTQQTQGKYIARCINRSAIQIPNTKYHPSIQLCILK